MSDFSKPPNPYATESAPLIAAPTPQPAASAVYAYAPPPTYDQATGAPPPQYVYGQPGYQAPAPGGYAVVVTDQHYSHPVVKEDNFCFGCIMGWLFGLFGLLCLLCVKDHRSYIRGWLIPFIIGLVVGIIMLILILTGVIGAYNST